MPEPMNNTDTPLDKNSMNLSLTSTFSLQLIMSKAESKSDKFMKASDAPHFHGLKF